tara:strand:+ start:1011 stop:1505 length:495 start_codon:yes stop_codon:yes gene_type:complete
MSSDFVVDTKEIGRSRFVIQVKTREAFKNPITLEKLSIERSYWREKEVPFFLVTENQVPPTVFENINVLYSHIEDDSDQEELVTYFNLFFSQIQQRDSLRIVDLCIQLDTAYKHEPGESLFQIKRLLAQRYFHFDISKPFTDLRCTNLTAESLDVLQGGWCVSS